MISGIHGKWGFSKGKATGVVCLLGFCASLLFATGSGLHWLELVDHFVANFGLVSIGLVECLLLGWVVKPVFLREHANKTSDILLGRWWDVLIRYVIPVVLTILLVGAIVNNIVDPYMGYPWWIILLGGIVPLAAIVIGSMILMKRRVKAA